MENKPKKPSTYDMLKKLDKKVQQNKTQQKDDSNFRNSSNFKRRRSPSPRRNDSRRKRSESPRRQDRRPPKRFEEDDIDYDVPDRSFGDLYCKACDSHMNSDQMWEAHIQGKRHQKHIKRSDVGEMKFEILHEDPLILPEIKKATEPIIGLQHCCEIRRLEGKPNYQCFLCSANVPNGQLLIEHVIGLKHRMAYLKEHDPVKHDLIDKTNLKRGMIEPVVAECIRLHQDKHGTGIMQIKLDKTKPSVPLNQNYKKPSQDNFDRDMKRDDRRSNYHDERDEGFRYDKQQDYQRPHYSEDRYEDRYPPFPADRDVAMRRYLEPPHPMDRRSPIAYERFDYETFSPTASNRPSSYTSWQSRPPESNSDNLRLALEQRRETQEKSSSSSSNLNLFQSLLKIIETMPSMMFLEIVLHKVESMDPTESELAMLQKIGNHMISFVMNRKLQKLSPDLLGVKCQGNSKAVEEQSNKSTNNLNSLMNLVSQFNSSKAASSSSFNWESETSPPDKPNNPAFMTQTPGSFYNSWGSSSSTEIPGLTLSSPTNEEANEYLPKMSDADDRQASWSAPSFRNNYGF